MTIDIKDIQAVIKDLGQWEKLSKVSKLGTATLCRRAIEVIKALAGMK